MIIQDLLNALIHVKGQLYSLNYHSHQQYELYFFHNGQCRYLINNQIHDLRPGDIIALDGTELHKPHVIGDPDRYERSMIHFSASWIENSLKELNALYLLDIFRDFPHQIFRLRDKRSYNEIINLGKELADLTKEDLTDAKEVELKLILMKLLLKVYQANRKTIVSIKETKSEKDKYAEKIATYLQQHFTEKISIEILSKELNISKSYISHVFKESTGYSVMEFLMDYRLVQAKFQIENGSAKTVKEIAYDCGFESDAHFNRFFKLKIGMTPNRYRKEKESGMLKSSKKINKIQRS
ncbi:AraC family transcriptional regulator [Desemzia sp. RIT804]|uniref:AraC family transcriptional regulator n=1 Tax=Desemzia sp. RIT 804 TaxID=2810209 RepID=UPI00194E9B10|nr:AraC family transcriptional regulator [Desemzia sp. RIT 804]MBM6615718.1 AraC family transcriptional regulator [Desemzia sp. RIT 804]